MKRLKLIAFAIVVCAVSALNVKVMLNSEHAEDMAATTLAAIGEGTPGESGESGESESGENGVTPYSCTVTMDCGVILSGSVSCTGTECKRGVDWLKAVYVECNGHRTYC